MARARVIATAVTVVVAAVAASAPAYGVQTDRFGLQATGSRSHIFYPPGSSPVHDSVLVYNRTRRAITLDLDVVGVTAATAPSTGTPSPGATPAVDYHLGGSGDGLAKDVHLATRVVRLAPHARQTVTLTIDRPRSAATAEYAAVTAVEEVHKNAPGLVINQRLAVLIGITAGSSPAAGGVLSGGGGRLLATVLAGLLAAAVAAGLLLRRRRPGG